MSLNIEIQTKKLARQLLSQIHKIELELDMQENELMRYSEAIGNATDSAARAELSPTLMVACLTRYIDVVVRCADDEGFRPNWSARKAERHEHASV